MKKIILLALALAAQQTLSADLYDLQTGKYLGQLGGNEYAPNSTSNKYGRYGSDFSQDSINNKYGTYGNPYSNKSPNNPYATHPPVIIDNGGYEGYYRQ